MPLVRACAPVPEVDLLAAYGEYCDRLGLTGVNLRPAARTFLRRWPDPQRWAEEPLATRLAVSEITRAFVMFLMLAGHLRPGYDYLIRRKLPGFWRQMPPGPLAEDLARFLAAAAELGFTERTRSGTASQVIGRLLIQTGRRLDALTGNDFDDLLAASAARHGGAKPSRHYSSAAHTARQVLFHLGVLTAQPVNATSLLRQSFEAEVLLNYPHDGEETGASGCAVGGDLCPDRSQRMWRANRLGCNVSWRIAASWPPIGAGRWARSTSTTMCRRSRVSHAGSTPGCWPSWSRVIGMR